MNLAAYAFFYIIVVVIFVKVGQFVPHEFSAISESDTHYKQNGV